MNRFAPLVRRLCGGLAPVAATLAALLAGGCERGAVLTEPDAGPPPLDAPVADAGADDMAAPAFTVVRVLPDHGPFSGGNLVTIRGSGFGSTPFAVRFGDVAVPPADVRRIDPNRLEVRVPAQAPGDVDVTVDDGSEPVTLRGGYTYDAFDVSPRSGPPGGGIRLTVRAASDAFDAATLVRLDGLACTDWMLRSGTEGSCVVPAHDLGTVDVSVNTRGATTVLDDAFAYESPFRPFGGLGGGPIDGELTVLVNDSQGRPLEGALVVAGRDGAYPFHAFTGPTGTVTFRDATLRGRTDVFASHRCFHHQGLVGVDAAYVSAALQLAYLGCLPGGGAGAPPPPPTGRGTANGEIVFFAGQEFPTPTFDWNGVPEPASGEQRVAYVALATGSAERGLTASPVLASTRITEADRGTQGYRFRFENVPGATLVAFGVAGLESEGRFTPHVVGLARAFTLTAGGTIDGVVVRMDARLVAGRAIGVRAPALPVVYTNDFGDAIRPGTIDRYRAFVRHAVPGFATGLSLFGFLAEGSRGGAMPVAVSAPEDFRGMPGEDVMVALQASAEGSFASALHEVLVVLEAQSSAPDALWYQQPHTRVVVREPLGPGRIDVGAERFLDIPAFTVPAAADAPLGAARTIRWEHDGGHSLYRLSLRPPFDGGFSPGVVWYVVAHPSVRAVTLPDLEPWSGEVEPLRVGTWRVILEANEVPALDFDRIDLRALDVFPIRRAALNQTNFRYEVP
jgi:hypothetical protein